MTNDILRLLMFQEFFDSFSKQEKNIILRKAEGFTHREIISETGKSKNKINSVMKKAKANWNKYIG